MHGRRNNVKQKYQKSSILRRQRIAAVFAAVFVIAFVCAAQQAVDHGFKDVNGTRLYYETIGEGIPIVVVHGGPGLDHSYLLPQMANLGRGFKLIMYDQRAMGKSSLDVDTSSMTIDTFVEDLEGIRKAFNLTKMNLLGHSWGGLIAMFYATKYPDHLQSLILSNTTAASSELRSMGFRTMAQRATNEDSAAQAAIAGSDAFKKRDPATMTRFLRLLFRGSFHDKRFADSLSLNFDSTYPARSVLVRFLSRDPKLRSYDLHPMLDTVRCPTLIIAGADDRIAPGTNEQIHERIRGSELITLDDCGHFPFIEAPRKYFGLIRRFLKKSAQ